MDKLLIVNADDFGLCKAQNYGIIDAFSQGVVTSTTVMVNAEGSEHAALLSAATPELATGLHFVLTQGQPLSPMPGLVRGNNQLGKWIWALAAEGTLPLKEIEQELACQYDRFTELFGRPPDHIDSHHHVHMIPQIYPLIVAFATEKDLPIRLDREAVNKQGITVQSARSTQGFDSGFYGDTLSESLFLQIVDNAAKRQEQSLEIMCHPSFIDRTILASQYCYPRLTELDILTSASLKQAISERGFRLGTFREV